MFVEWLLVFCLKFYIVLNVLGFWSVSFVVGSVWVFSDIVRMEIVWFLVIVNAVLEIFNFTLV